MDDKIKGKKIAILVENGFEQVELLEPKLALQNSGAETEVISPQIDIVKGWDHTKWGVEMKVDKHINDANESDYDALLLPGGVMNPDKLRMNQKAVEFIRSFYESGKPIAAICHGPWTLIEAGIVENKKMTSYPSLKTDLINAGARWVDEPVVVDNGIITSRKPDDIPKFDEKMIEEIKKGVHERVMR
ncbi:MAG: type 1 glutamine amidotransferase [Ignavibacteriae bacterium]|nr:MAG: type 1 glutamine amidotransferase [Ignavibacteriota bacterium]